MSAPDLNSAGGVAAFVESHAAHIDRARAHAIARGRRPEDVIVILFISDEPERPSQIVAGHCDAALKLLEQLVEQGRCEPSVADELRSRLAEHTAPELVRVLVCAPTSTSLVLMCTGDPSDAPKLTRTEMTARHALGWLLLQHADNPDYAPRADALRRWQERAHAALLDEKARPVERDELTVLWERFGSPELFALFETGDAGAALDFLLAEEEGAPS